MKIKVNDKSIEVPDALTVTDLLAHQKVKMPDMVSVQLNGTIVDRKAFSTTSVHENDTVDFLYFMGGGSRIVGRSQTFLCALCASLCPLCP